MPTITALEEILKLIGDCTVLIGDVVTNGLNQAELAESLNAFIDLKTAVADAALVIPEYLALNDEAKAQLEAYVTANVTYPENMTVQNYIQAAFNFALSLSTFAQLLKGAQK